MAQVQFACFSCSTTLTYAYQPGRRDECPKCGADVHVCKNCQQYDAKSYNECREPQADVVKEKDRANFCDYFAAGGSRAGAGDAKADLLAAAEALFKKKT